VPFVPPKPKEFDKATSIFISRVVEVAFGVGVIEIGGRRRYLVGNGEDAEHRLDTAGGPEQVTGH